MNMVKPLKCLTAKAGEDEPVSDLGANLVPRRSKRIRNQKALQSTVSSEFTNTSEESGFMSIAPDEVLLEIFARLPNCQSVFRCVTVCRRWFSLIKNHRQYLESCYPSILFSFSPKSDNQAFHELFPERSAILHRRGKPTIESHCLDFLPDWPGVVVRASWGDLLLVSRSPVHYLICNPLTRQWITLPEVPAPGFIQPCAYGLAFQPNKHSYRVMLVTLSSFSYDSYSYMFGIFSSETGQWTPQINDFIRLKHRIRSYEAHAHLPLDLVTTGSGVLHWLDGNGENGLKFKGIIAFNPFSMQHRFINLPSARRCFNRVPRPSKDKICLGVVRGRLRLSRILKINRVCFGLKIWELDEDGSDEGNGSWLLVHKVSLKRVDNMVFVLALHPTDGNVVFVVCDSKIFRLNIGQKKYEKVGEFPGEDESPNILKEKVASNLKVFTLLHSLWPTPVPQLPSV